MTFTISGFKSTDELNHLTLKIEKLRLKLTEFSNDQLIEASKSLYQFRIASSTTTKKQGQDFWLNANLYTTNKIKEFISPTWFDILEINKILSPIQNGKIRDCDVYIGNHKACGPTELRRLILEFNSTIITNTKNLHPLLWASEVRYWIVTLHPFVDGNGRTSNLVCDWILALNGFLPISHNSRLDSFIAGWQNRAHFSDLNYATTKTLSSVEHSYNIMLSRLTSLIKHT
jgi:Fic family protein